MQFGTPSAVNDSDNSIVVKQKVHTCATGAVTRTKVQRRQTAPVSVVHPRAKIQQSLETIRSNGTVYYLSNMNTDEILVNQVSALIQVTNR